MAEEGLTAKDLRRIAQWCSKRKITPILDPYDEFAVPYYVVWSPYSREELRAMLIPEES